MKGWVVVVLVVVAAVVLAVAAGAWWVVKRPLAVFETMGKRALQHAGLARSAVASPVGEQAVWVGGSGPAVLLLHGAGDSAATWARVVPGLVQGHRLLVPDLAGHGASAPSTGPIEMRAVLEGAEAVLATVPAGERVTLVGNSLGAWVAMLLAHRHGDRVAAVVCLDAGAIAGHNEAARVLPRSRQEAAESVAQTRDPGSPAVPGYVLDDIVRQAHSGPLARFAATAATMGGYLLDGRLAEIRPPVHLLWGASDRLVPVDYARRMQAELPSATLGLLEHCGHVPQVECPERLLAALRPLLPGAR